MKECAPGKDLEIKAGYDSVESIFKGAVATRNPNYDLGDRWVLEVGSWARGTYVLRMAHRGRVETHKFVLTE